MQSRRNGLDRTEEFHSTAESFRKQMQPQQKAITLAQRRRPPYSPASASTAAFQQAEDAVMKSIASLEKQLKTLAKLARKKSLFDDQATEIDQLTSVIKRDLEATTQLVSGLQNFVASNQTGAQQADTHAARMVEKHNSSLARLFQQFKDVLNTRQVNLKKMTDRKMQYANVGGGIRQRSRFAADTSEVALQEQEQLLRPSSHRDRYVEQRADAVQSIESTISELGEMYQRLTTIISMQHDQAVRIDANMDSTIEHTEAGYNELLKYYKNISSNRGLILKIFFILILFAVLFIVLT